MKKKFSNYLLEKNLLTKKDLDKAITTHKKQGISLVEILIKLGYIKEIELVSALSEYLSIPPVRVLNLNISQKILSLIPEKIAKHYKVLPLGKIGNILTLATSDPLDILAIDDIKKITKCEVNPVVSPLSEIKKAINDNYPSASPESIEDIIKNQDLDSLHIIKDGKTKVTEEEIVHSIEEAPVIKFTNYILKKSVQEKASDILVEPLEESSRIRLRIDGVLQEVENFSKKIHSFVVSRIKVMCNLNITEHRLPQEGRFRCRILDRDIDFRVSILPSSLGEKVAVRVLDKGTALLNLDLLGFEKDVVKSLKEDSLKPHGLLLVCGPTGAGKTTTLYSIISHIYTPEKNIVTVEDPIEYQLKGINQVSINSAINLTFAVTLRSILRQDPDSIMIGEIRDPETADMAIKSALTGHLVLSTLHTTTSPGSVTRLVNMDVEPFLLSSTLIGVITQRLARKLCPKCREEYTLSDSIKEKYLIDKKVTLYKPKGCNFCQNSGYKGRISLSEYLRISQKMRQLIDSCASENEIKKEARREGMRTLREDGIIKLQEGITTLEEVIKVTGPDEILKK